MRGGIRPAGGAVRLQTPLASHPKRRPSSSTTDQVLERSTNSSKCRVAASPSAELHAASIALPRVEASSGPTQLVGSGPASPRENCDKYESLRTDEPLTDKPLTGKSLTKASRAIRIEATVKAVLYSSAAYTSAIRVGIAVKAVLSSSTAYMPAIRVGIAVETVLSSSNAQVPAIRIGIAGEAV